MLVDHNEKTIQTIERLCKWFSQNHDFAQTFYKRIF